LSNRSNQSFKARASMTRKVADSPRSVALRLALVIGSSRKSMPVTLWPRLAKKRAFSPVPQPASRAEPVIRSATSRKGFCGLPMSQGAWAAQALSNVLRSGTVVMFLPLSSLLVQLLARSLRPPARGPL
jgi:hypothetical protein